MPRGEELGKFVCLFDVTREVQDFERKLGWGGGEAILLALGLLAYASFCLCRKDAAFDLAEAKMRASEGQHRFAI